MAWIRTATTVGAVALTAAAGSAQSQSRQVVTGPVATYWMSAQTTSGFGAGMMGGGGPGGRPGGRPSMGALMGMSMGRGGGAQHGLVLQLGSSRAPTGAPQAEHLPPQGLGAGPSLPLVTPQAAPQQRVEEQPSMPREYQKPKGKMLIFWGCGDHARPGQPLVIDFAQMAEGKVPPGMEAMTRGLGVTPMQPPSPARNRTYGEWPNPQARTTVPSEGSLVGPHTVRGDYSPEIKFTLSQDQDFLAPLQFLTNAVGPMGSAQLGWNAVPNARGYLASVIGGGENDTVVLWTSSEVQASAFSLPDYLSNGDLARLVASHALLDPQTTRCAVPKEVVQAAPHGMVQLAAYGGEANFSYPPRPTDPRQPWNIEWTVKVRYKSQTGGLLGMDMPGGGRGEMGEGGQGQGRPGQPQKPRGRPGLGDVLKGLGGIPQL
jgi:hypothetical protein